MPAAIEDYALLGDGETAALVHRDGSVDWLCWPRFDSDACFAALLGTPANGRWQIGPVDPGKSTRRYQDDTLVLETLHETGTGVVRVVDFMPPRQGRAALVRIIEGVSGTVPMQMLLCLRANYGAVAPWLEPAQGGFAGHVGACRFLAQGTLEMQAQDGTLRARFNVAAGQTHHITLLLGAADTPAPAPEALLAQTQAHWRNWIGGFNAPTDWPAAVKRSLITLKALAYHPTGAIVAAPTTSLPEAPGGTLNWDYRFCWIRDASFTVNALLNAGLRQEVRAWRDWMLRTMGGEPDKLRIMYRVTGERHIPESELEWLHGFNHAPPVRIGNIASTQHQADVHGELLEALHLAAQAGIAPTPQQLEAQTQLVEHIAATWREHGAGLWESRAEPRHYVYSRAMDWVGVDRMLKAPAACAHAGPKRVARWRELRDEIHADVCAQGFHPGLNRFVEYYGGQAIDACLLLLPVVGFLPVDDPRIAATIAAVEAQLLQDGLVRRKPATGEMPEGAFIACTLWLADCQAMQGRHEAARRTLTRVLETANDVGLLAEEYNVPGRHLAGNFPQALSHLALVNTALGLCGPVLQRGGG